MEADTYQQVNGLESLFEDDDDVNLMDMDFQDATPANESFAMPQDDNGGELDALLGEGAIEGGENFDLNELNDRQLDVGDKADDAVDYEDIDDDDLPDEEGPGGVSIQAPHDLLPGIGDTEMQDFDDDDLFGPSSPTEPFQDLSAPPALLPVPSVPAKTTAQDTSHRVVHDNDKDSDLASDHGDDTLHESEAEADEEEDEMFKLQQLLFAQSGKGAAPTTEGENLEEWLKLEFPQFNHNEDPFWSRLLPAKPGRWQGKAPSKPPKPTRPSKVTLEVEPDHKTLFTSTGAAAQPVEFKKDVVRLDAPKAVYQEEDASDDSDVDEVLPGGLTMQDLNFICTNFDAFSEADTNDEPLLAPEPKIVDEDRDMFGFDEDFGDMEQPVKKRRIGVHPQDVIKIHRLSMPSFDSPEKSTAKIGRKVVLDLNDPELLVEEMHPEAVRTKAKTGEKPIVEVSLRDQLNKRFKTSNDAAYDLLKQNHQHKVRGQLSHMTIDHSVPAVRLQYPYYKVDLPINELRNYHRKRMRFLTGIAFSKVVKHKRKERKNKSAKELYPTTKDLSPGDNSSVLLLEYSEEHPTMLSQTGMGNKIVNYYRRKTADDTSRPKADVGETSVLLPEDKSPFHNFGHIDPGENTMALYNSMYRAPIFEQVTKPQDFLIVRESTGMNGAVHYLREIDGMFVVGQELPSVTVPGTHSRMVTTASKNRLKTISWRIARRKKTHRIRVEDVTRHFPDTNDMQNRQKMKEFMVFSKEHKEWEMKAGEALPDEEAIQQLVKPEDICLLESMQVGAQYLKDAGYAEDAQDDDDDAKDNENDSFEQQLAPWKTTKNFIQATQGKAMLKLFGEGDPSGRGEAFSFIKTSMKGGFKALGVSVHDTLADAKALGGHSYNVARQQKSYEESIRKIWDKQKANLSSHIEPDDIEDEGVDGQEDAYQRKGNTRAVSVAATPGPGRRRDDETATSFSKRSMTSQAQKYLRITRKVYNEKTGEYTSEEHIETDPAVIKNYIRRKEEDEINAVGLTDVIPTGDVDYDARQKKRLEEALARLEKNKARRQQRDKTKAALNAASPGAMSPDGEPSTPAVGGRQVQATQRKCANCGQVGHIKTNKKLCPLLNGTVKQEDGFNNAAFMGAPPTFT